MRYGKILAVFLLLVIMMVGCSNNKISQNRGNELEKISIMLDWYPNAVHSALYVAKEKGYFEEQGLDVHIQMPADTNDPLKLAATGKVDMAISYQSQVVQSRAEGIPVVSIAAYVRHSLDAIMMKKEAGIDTPKDLEGKRIGYPSTVITEAVIKTMVEHDDGDFSKVNMTDVGWDLIPAVATDKVDAIGGGYVNHELLLLNREGYEMDALQLVDYGVPDNYELVVVAGEKTFNKKKASMEKFWKAVTKGQQFVKENREESLQILLANENTDSALNIEVETESLNILLPMMEDEGTPFGYQEEESWREVADWLYEVGVIETNVDPQQFIKNIVSK